MAALRLHLVSKHRYRNFGIATGGHTAMPGLSEMVQKQQGHQGTLHKTVPPVCPGMPHTAALDRTSQEIADTARATSAHTPSLLPTNYHNRPLSIRCLQGLGNGPTLQRIQEWEPSCSLDSSLSRSLPRSDNNTKPSNFFLNTQRMPLIWQSSGMIANQVCTVCS